MSAGSVENRVALVTGASSGIGRATTLALLGAGIHVIGMARNSERLAQLEEDAREFQGDVLTIAGDVTRREDVARAVKEGVARFGRLDILVANAGVGLRGDLVGAEWAALESLLRTNVDGVLHSIRAAVPAMRESGGGHIITISSLAAPLIVPYSAAYAASKAFLSSMAHSLRLELEDEGILVTDMLVGRTATEFDSRRLGAGAREAGSSLPVMSAEEVARGVMRVIDRPRRSVTLRLFNRLILLAGRLAPDLLGRMARRQYR
ncbi:MAG: SDR family NAD(P)-dependent oxidoreductase [Anaerolineaceae bacterium]|nr:SDR family NAD(P)-dependent oxidoreductase [Anaerolineaceae bacterium]